jgi:hypothetical protein
MRTRGEARREEEEAAAATSARFEALCAAFASQDPARELEAALAAIGPPGSPPVLAALAIGDHGLLRAACASEWRLAAAVPLLRAYGEPLCDDACAGIMRALDATGHVALPKACGSDMHEAVAALLAAYRRAGRSLEVLAADDHAALHAAAGVCGDLFIAVLAECGEPGSAPVLAALASRGHLLLRNVCRYALGSHAQALLAAYGPSGCAPVRGALAPEDFGALRDVFARCGVPAAHVDVDVDADVDAAAADDDDPYSYYSARMARHAARAHRMVATHFDQTLTFVFCALDDFLAALRVVNAVLAERPDLPARLIVDSFAARLAVRAPAAWAALGNGAARALLSPALRAERLLPKLLALRRLPVGVAQPVIAYLRAHECVLYAVPQCCFDEPAAGAAGGAGA